MSAVPNMAPVLVGAKIEPELKRQLVERAHANERNVSQEIRVALRRHVQQDMPVASAVARAAVR